MCAGGTYSTSVGAVGNVCLGCPARSNSPEGSDENIDCTCNRGASGINGGTCTKCVAGKFKDVRGAAPCVSCETGQFSTVIAAESNVCNRCPANTQSSAASDELTDCTCTPGFTGPNGKECRGCAAGTFKIASGPGVCTNCFAGRYSPTVNASSNVCQVCPADSNAPAASDEKTDCHCNAGASGNNGGECASCGAGTYKPFSGPAPCSVCPDNSNSPPKSTTKSSCVCNAGFSGPNGGECVPCSAGTFKPEPGAQLFILSVKFNVASCQTACTCNAGTSGPDGGTCTNCPADTLKFTLGAASCFDCQTSRFATCLCEGSKLAHLAENAPAEEFAKMLLQLRAGTPAVGSDVFFNMCVENRGSFDGRAESAIDCGCFGWGEDGFDAASNDNPGGLPALLKHYRWCILLPIQVQLTAMKRRHRYQGSMTYARSSQIPTISIR